MAYQEFDPALDEQSKADILGCFKELIMNSLPTDLVEKCYLLCVVSFVFAFLLDRQTSANLRQIARYSQQKASSEN